MAITISKVNTNPLVTNAKNISFSGLQDNKPSFDGFPKEIKSENLKQLVKWMGDDFDSAMQRFVSGVTAIVTQPFFDRYNQRTDEKTRKTSCARTMGKIIAGTLTGVIIREACIQLTKKFTQNENYNRELMQRAEEKGKHLKLRTEFKSWEQCFLTEAGKHASYREIKKYRGAVGTFAAVFIMIFTNFLIDAPLTTYLTNKITKNFFGIAPAKKQAEGGNK